jgi:3-oxoacyl-[acyl-carrier-protein] synthase-3
MNGREVFRFATRVMAEAVQSVLEKAELDVSEVSLVVPHQANVRIIESAAKRLKMEPARFFMNLERAGNTSTASIPIALCEAIEAGRLQPNDNVVFVGFGGGLTWGAAVVKWDVAAREAAADELSWRRSPWYLWARIRSALRRTSRRWLARLAGSPTPEARLRDATRERDDRDR